MGENTNDLGNAGGDSVGERPEGTLSWADLLREGTARLGEALGGDRSQEARWIVERVSGYSPTELRLERNELVSSRAVSFFDQLIARRQSGEPLQYVLGRWQFRSLELVVNRHVLIPRPETEIVAEHAITLLRQRASAVVGRTVTAVDLGTGSGAIALALAVEVPPAQVWAGERSAQALAVARANLAGIGRAAARVTLTQGSWFEALPADLAGHVDVLVSNPPYVRHDELDALPVEVRDWEPHDALFADADGTADLDHLIAEAPRWLAPGGWLVLEMAPSQTEWALAAAAAAGLQTPRIEHDLAGKPRALLAQRPGDPTV